MERSLIHGAGVWATIGTLILVACGVGYVNALFAPLLFAVSLGMMVVCVVRLFRRGHRRAAWIIAAVCFVLLLLSFFPVYVRHYVPWRPDGGSYHRHILWELGHVH